MLGSPLNRKHAAVNVKIKPCGDAVNKIPVQYGWTDEIVPYKNRGARDIYNLSWKRMRSQEP